MIRRTVVWGRAHAGGPCSDTRIEVAARSREGGGLEVEFLRPTLSPEPGLAAAEATLAATIRALPPALAGRLVVEAGRVRTAISEPGGERPLFDTPYRIATCRGVVLGVHAVGESEPIVPFDSPWQGSIEPEDLDARLPVVLAPSATLALVSYALEVTGAHQDEGDYRAPGLSVTDTAASPYPPQHHPFTGDGTAAGERPLIAVGEWADRQEHAGGGVDSLFILLTRPDRALRPLAAATHFNRRNLRVASAVEVSPLPAAVVIDSWRVRVGPRSGPVPFDGELSWREASGLARAVAVPVGLALDPWLVLAHVVGAESGPLPALDEDPIEGDSYGLAPTLVTDLTLTDLLPEA